MLDADPEQLASATHRDGLTLARLPTHELVDLGLLPR